MNGQQLRAVAKIRADAKRRVAIMKRAERYFAELRRDLSVLSEDRIADCEETITILITSGPLRDLDANVSEPTEEPAA